MNQHGGYRRPANPAPTSGPGAASRRTDGQPSVDSPKQAARYISGMPQGEAAEVNAVAGAAPMAAAPDLPAAPRMVPLRAPTERPDEPVTSGAPFGPGSNTPPTTVGVMDDIGADEVSATVRAMLLAYPSSPWLRQLVNRLNDEGR